MKPVIKMFGYGVYRVDSIQTSESLLKEMSAMHIEDLETINNLYDYLNNLNGKTASKAVLKRILEDK